jgi:hypothetical protein
LTIEEFGNYLESIHSKSEEIYPLVLENLVKINIFSVLQDNDFNNFHKKLYKIASYKHGIGIAVSCMAQVNIVGRILQIEKSQGNKRAGDLLYEIINGKSSISIGVSERGWGGRITKTKTSFQVMDGRLILNGEKSFLTNGANSSHYIIICKDENEKFYSVLLEKNRKGLKIKPFQLEYAKEATHAIITFEDIEIFKEDFLILNYKDYSENLQLSELLSLSVIGCSYLTNVVQKNIYKIKKPISKEKILKNIDHFLTYIFYISNKKTMDTNIILKDYFPFGFTIILENWKIFMSQFHSDLELKELYPDLLLFDLLKDEFRFSRNSSSLSIDSF